jgi:hypothetical protein
MNAVREEPANMVNCKECPPPEKLLDYCRNRISRRDKKKIIRHVVNCVACLDETRAIQNTLIGERLLFEDVADLAGINIGGSTKRILNKQRHNFWLIAGSAAVAFSLFFIVILIVKNKESSLNDQIRGSIYEILTIEPHGDVYLSKWNGFHWRGVKGAEYYVVSIYDESLKVVWKSDRIRSENLALSFEILDIFRKGKNFSWQVVGKFSDGRTEKSKPVEITVY